jgi:hypothetical protein
VAEGDVTDPTKSEVARKLKPGQRVLVDGRRATFTDISDGKELYEFSLEPEGVVPVFLEDLDRRVELEHWEDEPEPDWLKEAEKFLMWNSLRQRQLFSLSRCCHPHPDDTDQVVLKKAVRIIQGMVRRAKE